MRKVIFALLAFAIGIWLIIQGYGLIKIAKASAGWPTVKGTVKSSSTKRMKPSSTGRKDITYRAEVVYDYSVENIPYSSRRIAFEGYSSDKRRHAHQIVTRYPEGREVTVYYKPGQPEMSVLEPGDSWSTYWTLGLGVVFCSMGLILLFSKRKFSRRLLK